MANRIALLGTLFLAACNGHLSVVDESFSAAVRATMRQQTLNPRATRESLPSGLDGVTGKATIDRYQKSFEASGASSGSAAVSSSAQASR